MAERRLLKMGNPLLHHVAQPVVEFDSAALDALVTDLWDTMEARSGVGLAAPQIGVGLRVVVFGMASHPRYPEAEPIPRTVLVNPQVAAVGEATEEGWEGCLSLPGMRGLVPRYYRIGYRGYDPQGRQLEREVAGFHARVVQHECDHLDGRLYPQRIRDLALFGFEEELSLAGRLNVPKC